MQDDAGIIQNQREATIVLVGCGGTGGFLAEAICRPLIGRHASLLCWLLCSSDHESREVGITLSSPVSSRWGRCPLE
jgi:hypothetical protein